MDKQQHVFVVYDDSFFLWAVKMVLSALLTPLWILLAALGITFDFN